MSLKSIVRAWVNDLRDVLGNEPLTVEDVRVGVF